MSLKNETLHEESDHALDRAIRAVMSEPRRRRSRTE